MSDSPYDIIINEGNSLVLVIRNWLPTEETVKNIHGDSKEASQYVTQEELWDVYENEIPWFQTYVGTPVGPKPAAHLTYVCGDDEVKQHTYARNGGLEMNPWHPTLRKIRDRIHRESGLYTNACLPLKYRSLNDSVGFHRDKEVDPPHNVVISVSVGQSRIFVFKRDSDNKRYRTWLHSGDMCIMWGDTQKNFMHSIEKLDKKYQPDPQYDGVRYVVTFRQLRGINLKDSSKAREDDAPIEEEDEALINGGTEHAEEDTSM